MLRVGLTGGIAAGKSRVLRRFEAAGFAVLDLDRVAHRLMEPGGPAYADVVAEFGAGILGADGRIDRAVLGARVFGDAAARARLDAIVHPRVRAEERQLAAAHADDAVVVTDAALLVEAGMHLRFDRLVVVVCPPAVQVRRLMARDGLDEPAARARVEAQLPGHAKAEFAHHVIDSDGPLEVTDRAADEVAARLRALAAAPLARGFVEARARGALVHGPAAGPGGLRPRDLLAHAAEQGGFDLQALARRRMPPAAGRWLSDPLDGEARPAAALMAPVALWARARRGDDADLLGWAAASVARLTHPRGPHASAACVQALALSHVVAGGDARELPVRAPGWAASAARWGGAAPPRWTDVVLHAAAAHPGDPAAARAACGADGAPPELAAALAGAAVDVAGAETPAEVAADLRRLLAR